MRRCKHCGIEKNLELMVKDAFLCKLCKNERRRTGGPVGCPKGRVPWNKGKGLARYGWRNKEWAKAVKERDNYICHHCELDERTLMQAHHIVPWKDSVELRFELSNGMTLCRKCHKKEDRRLHPELPKLRAIPVDKEKIEKMRQANLGRIPWNKGKELSREHIDKISASLKGRESWNKGTKGKRSWRINQTTGKRVWIDKI